MKERMFTECKLRCVWTYIWSVSMLYPLSASCPSSFNPKSSPLMPEQLCLLHSQNLFALPVSPLLLSAYI